MPRFLLLFVVPLNQLVFILTVWNGFGSCGATASTCTKQISGGFVLEFLSFQIPHSLIDSRVFQALETQTRNPDVLCNLGIVTMRLLECTTDWKSLDFERDPVLAQIESYFLRAESECAMEMQSIRSKVEMER